MWSKALQNFIEDYSDLIEQYPKTASEITNEMWKISTTFNDCEKEMKKLFICLHYLKFGLDKFILNGITGIAAMKVVLCDTDSAKDFLEVLVGLGRSNLDGSDKAPHLTEKDIREILHLGMTVSLGIPDKVAKEIAMGVKIDGKVFQKMIRYRSAKAK